MNLNNRAMAAALLAIALVGCSSSAAPGASSAAQPTVRATPTGTPNATPTPTPTATLQPTAQPTPNPIPTPAPTAASIYPTSYATLSSRNWAKVVKAPDNYIGKGYKLWGCISQFDAATGAGSFRAETSYRKESYWYSEGTNAFFNGSEDGLADFVQDDVLAMDVMSLGSYSYDTQNGGNTTVPLFLVMKIKRVGSCA
jgi:hypothetical protein